MRKYLQPQNFLGVLKLVSHAAVWRSTQQPIAAGLPTLFIFSIVGLLVDLASQYATASAPVRFTPYGLNSSLANVLVAFAVVTPFVRSPNRLPVFCALTGLGVLSDLAIVVVALGSKAFGLKFEILEAGTANSWGVLLIYPLVWAWWIGAASALFRSVEPERRLAVPRALGLALTLIVTLSALPLVPAFRGSDFDIRRANYWEYISAYIRAQSDHRAEKRPRIVDDEQVELAQVALLDSQVSALSAQTRGKTDIYAIGLVGAASEDVFLNEMNGGLESLAHFLSIDGGIVRLINHPDTVGTVPVASRQNFAAAVRSIARVMDPEEDVLLLFMTSHGSSDGVFLSLPDVVWGDLTPAGVAKVLDNEHIKNRIIIVSACYSEVFLKPLANENTVILTAADEEHPSFGCANEREWTYFGDAFFNRSLRIGGTIEEAFLDAKVTIKQWETRDGLPPSNPQGYFGPVLMKKLTPLYLKSKNALNSERSIQR